MIQKERVSCFWILENKGRFIASTSTGTVHSDWGPEHLPVDDIFRAKRFNTPDEALEFANSPGEGWIDFAPIKVGLTISIKKL